MAAEAIADPLFLDTSLIVAATVEAHPAHKAASSFVAASPKHDRCWSACKYAESSWSY
jgi:hypothetical protein